jgi:hypothetical protein
MNEIPAWALISALGVLLLGVWRLYHIEAILREILRELRVKQNEK